MPIFSIAVLYIREKRSPERAVKERERERVAHTLAGAEENDDGRGRSACWFMRITAI